MACLRLRPPAWALLTIIAILGSGRVDAATSVAHPAPAAGSKALLTCGPRKMQGRTFSVACTATGNALNLTLTLSGTADMQADLANLRALTIVQAHAKPQTLSLSGQIGLDDVEHAAELIDVNFDGYPDIKLMTSTSAGPNAGYTYWLYDLKSGQFQASDIGDKLSGFDIMPDPKTRTIAANGRASCCEWETVTYKWAGDTLRVRSIVNDGLFNLADTPPLADDDPQICGTETKHYDDAERLVSVDYSLRPKDPQCADDQGASPKVPELLAVFRQKQKGYAIVVKDNNDFTIRYDAPLAGHNSP